MNSKNLIIQKLEQLVAQFAAIRVRYQFDGDHIVEISPASMLKDNKAFRLAIHDIFLDFEDQYMEELMFVTEDDLVCVENVTYQKAGSQYGHSVSLKVSGSRVEVSFHELLKAKSRYENIGSTEKISQGKAGISSGEPYALAA